MKQVNKKLEDCRQKIEKNRFDRSTPVNDLTEESFIQNSSKQN